MRTPRNVTLLLTAVLLLAAVTMVPAYAAGLPNHEGGNAPSVILDAEPTQLKVSWDTSNHAFRTLDTFTPDWRGEYAEFDGYHSAHHVTADGEQLTIQFTSLQR